MPHEVLERLAQDLGISEIEPGQLGHERADAAAHEGQRVGIPPGRTRFDWKKGEVRHLGTDTVLTDGLPVVEHLTNVGESKQDKKALRSVLAFTDVGTTLEIGGSNIPLDPCNYFPIQRRNFQTLTLTTKLPAQAYVIASARSQPFSDVVSNASHTNRIGVYSGTPDSWAAVPFETPETHHNGDLGAEARHPALHAQEFGARTFTVENTGSNDADVRLVGKTTHHGPFVDVDPSSQPVTVTAGSTETLTLNGEAWHVLKLETTNQTTGASVSLESHYAGVNA